MHSDEAQFLSRQYWLSLATASSTGTVDILTGEYVMCEGGEIAVFVDELHRSVSYLNILRNPSVMISVFEHSTSTEMQARGQASIGNIDETQCVLVRCTETRLIQH